jgi:1-aminocyclopropane-1-carboxylate deaminase/D-cysteine desulfhydrase-like pyridoxal-dependent ACC family enzyme
MLQAIQEKFIEEKKLKLYLLRLDLIHEHISGNKWYKLKYNIAEMQKTNQQSLLTFGGAYSNHIAAAAYAGKHYNIKTIGIIRGEEQLPLNHTLDFAKECGMHLHFISREDYKKKHTEEFLLNLKRQFGEFYVIPEGGSNELGLKGCKEIIDTISIPFNYIACACGTGTTLAGIISSLNNKQYAIGFSSLKGGGFLKDDIEVMLQKCETKTLSTSQNIDSKLSLSFGVPVPSFREGRGEVLWHIETNYHFGGYAKITKDLLEFIKNFKLQHHTQLDPIYTAKMMYGLYELIKKDYFPENSVIIAIHSGGLQGVKGIEDRLGIQL